MVGRLNYISINLLLLFFKAPKSGAGVDTGGWPSTPAYSAIFLQFLEGEAGPFEGEDRGGGCHAQYDIGRSGKLWDYRGSPAGQGCG